MLKTGEGADQDKTNKINYYACWICQLLVISFQKSNPFAAAILTKINQNPYNWVLSAQATGYRSAFIIILHTFFIALIQIWPSSSHAI